MPDDFDGPAMLTAAARSLGNEVAQLAHERRAYRTASDLLELHQRAFEMENADVIKRVNDLNSLLGATEKRVRAIAETAFRADGNKHPHPAVEIKMTKVVTYEPAAALKWATEEGMCLKLDAKALEALAKASPASLAGVCAVTEEPRAQISRDLSTVEV